jgi:hypothetical protein
VVEVNSNREEYIRSMIEDLKSVRYIMPDDIPNIDLYMDQVTTFMDKHLKSSKRYSEDKLLTKTMINNYTKNELLPPPNKKKYSKEHIYLLIFIYYFKNILSISDIQSIFNPLTERYFGKGSDIGLEDIYKEIFRLEKEQTDSLTKDMIRKMARAKESFADVEDKEDRDFLSVFAFICILCFDVYMRKHMIEQIIDNSLMGGDFKPDRLNAGKQPGKAKAVKPEAAGKDPARVKQAVKDPARVKQAIKDPARVKQAIKDPAKVKQALKEPPRVK